MRRKSWLARKRMSPQEKEEIEQKDDDKEERGSIIEVIPNKTAEAVKKGLAITNIKF